MDTRTRWKPKLLLKPALYRADSSQPWEEFPSGDVESGFQITESEGHRRLPNGSWDGGGPFYTAQSSVRFSPTFIHWTDPNTGSETKAHVVCPLNASVLPFETLVLFSDPTRLSPQSDNGKLLPYGTEAISAIAPTNPNAELLTGLAEAKREGLPSVPGVQTWKQRLGLLKSAGSEFLNVEFGWLPLIGEVKDVSSAISKSGVLLDQYHTGSGVTTRRRFDFPVETTEFDLPDTFSRISIDPLGQSSWKNVSAGVFDPMRVKRSGKVTKRRWFSGAFTYAYPDQSDAWSRMRGNADDANHLLGINPTNPDVLWELTPWSWAIDWFTNAGDVINNVNNFLLQGLAMRYGYMMEESIYSVTSRFDPDEGVNTLSGIRSAPSTTMEMVVKKRVPSGPFGFGISNDSLSATQIAIAVAVGITLL